MGLAAAEGFRAATPRLLMLMGQPTIKTKRVYEKRGRDDGVRYLVDRLWPRGVKKEDLNLDAWLKEAAPSDALRRWFNHDPKRWDAFRRRYYSELDAKPEAARPILEAARAGAVTLLFSARDETYNNAIALKEYLIGKLARESPGARKGRGNPAAVPRSSSSFKSVLPLGKLPNSLLDRLLGELGLDDTSLLIAPGVGQDVAAVRLEREEVLVLKTDPITLAADAIGYFSVIVNVNDLATCGATPRWFLTSLLLPPGTSAEFVRGLLKDLNGACREHGMTLCGGHTEITDAVTRPIVVGMAAGTVSKERLVDKGRVKEGDQILLTKGIAVEGTCVIAREIPERLKKLAMPEREIRKCRHFLTRPGISIVKEARIAADSGSATAMHDVTEGGVATALEELSMAGAHRIRVYTGRIPVLKETREICRLLEIDPLGLIGSGSLLICCERESSEDLMRSIRSSGIDVACIGEVLGEGTGVEAFDHKSGSAVSWPHFEVDELARLFSSL